MNKSCHIQKENDITLKYVDSDDDDVIVIPPPPEDTDKLSALDDFTNINSGAVPYYKDNNNNALAIDASKTAYRNKFAQAESTFNGESGTYSVTITTLTEEDTFDDVETGHAQDIDTSDSMAAYMSAIGRTANSAK